MTDLLAEGDLFTCRKLLHCRYRVISKNGKLRRDKSLVFPCSDPAMGISKYTYKGETRELDANTKSRGRSKAQWLVRHSGADKWFSGIHEASAGTYVMAVRLDNNGCYTADSERLFFYLTGSAKTLDMEDIEVLESSCKQQVIRRHM